MRTSTPTDPLAAGAGTSEATGDADATTHRPEADAEGTGAAGEAEAEEGADAVATEADTAAFAPFLSPAFGAATALVCMTSPEALRDPPRSKHSTEAKRTREPTTNSFEGYPKRPSRRAPFTTAGAILHFVIRCYSSSVGHNSD